jgi:hypothetical protein
MLRKLSAIVLALALPAAASATTFTYTAILSGAAEDPPVPSAGTGTVTVTYDDAAHSLSIATSWSGLTGNTTVAHIHCCLPDPPATQTAGVATTVPTFPGFPAGVTSGSYTNTFDLTLASSWNPAFIAANGGTTAGAEAALAAGLNAANAYFNIHSSFSGTGEIRGNLQLIPEPATALLVGLGTIGLAAARRRRQH